MHREDKHPTVEHLSRNLGSQTPARVKRLLTSLPPSEAARTIEQYPPRVRIWLWDLLDQEFRSEIFEYLNEDIQAELLEGRDTEEILDFAESLDDDDLADLLQVLPEDITEKLLASMDSADRIRIEAVMSWPEDSAGGLMNTDTISVRPDLTVDVVMRYLRRHERLPEATDSLMVVTRRDELVGMLPIRDMLVAHPNTSVREIMDTEFQRINANMKDTEVANLFERSDWISAPVVDDSGHLLGRITIDDVVDVIKEEADHAVKSMAGLNEEDDTFAPAMKTVRLRAIWLGINLLTAFLASSVIGLFQDTINKVVALAVLMPIVASMGGIAGTQTLTLVVRGMATGAISNSNYHWLFSRELWVGTMNGFIWAVVVGFVALLWFREPSIALIIAAAMIINLIMAALSGACLPAMLIRMKIDPALAGGVILTTVTDVVGFMTFLGLATLFL